MLNNFPLSLTMDQSALSHKRRCYFTPQGLSSGVMSLPCASPSQSELIFPSTIFLPPFVTHYALSRGQSTRAAC